MPDLWESIGATPDVARNETPEKTYFDYLMEFREKGRYGYMQMYPESTDPSYHWWDDPKYGVPSDVAEMYGRFGYYNPREAADKYDVQITGMLEYRRQFSGVEATYIRWLIDNRIAELRYMRASEMSGRAEDFRLMEIKLGKKEQAAIEGGWTPSAEYISSAGGRVGQERVDWAREHVRAAPMRPRFAPAPTPEWMGEYIEPTVSKEPGGGLFSRFFRKPSVTSTLRPLGAQAELEPEQLGLMAGYQAWRKAGAPTRYSEEAILKMADWRKTWDPYIKEAQALFPTKGKLRTGWSVATQR